MIARGLDVLGVEVILAGSPQAKGRIERSFGTAQDRLIKEMRVAGVDTLEGANRFLDEWWTPFWNERFTVDPRDPMDAHRTLPPRGGPGSALRGDGDTGGPARLHDPLPQRVLADPGAGGRARIAPESGRRGTAAQRGDPHPRRRPVSGGRVPGRARPRPRPAPPKKAARARAPSHPAPQSPLQGRTFLLGFTLSAARGGVSL